MSIRRSSKEITSSQIHRRKDNWQRVLYAVRLAHFELMSSYLTDLFVFIPSILHQWLWVTFCLRDYLCYSSAMAFFRTSKQLKVSSEMVRSWFPTAIAHADLLHSVGEAVIRSHIAQTGLAWKYSHLRTKYSVDMSSWYLIFRSHIEFGSWTTYFW